MMKGMRLLLVCLLVTFPVVVFGYVSVTAQPENATVVLPITAPQSGAEFFGVLNDFPHTYEFVQQESMPFTASVFVRAEEGQKNDVSLILVKQEKRGVSEIGRTSIKESTWEESYDVLYAESFRSGGTFEATLEPGVYTLEVSAPNNDGAYRLVIGTPSQNYFAMVRSLFEVKALFGSSIFSSLLSPLLYIPLLLVLLIAGLLFFRSYMRRI